jgi:eukaryotic-like serine/threonine-protein kinase
MEEALRERALQPLLRAGRIAGGHGCRLVGEITGGKSAVFVIEADDGTRYAVKIVKSLQGEMATCPVAFPAEAVNIFPVLDVFAWDDGYGLVMPVAEISLRQWLRQDEECSRIEALLAALADIARALESIEGKMVHGDLKPENVLRKDGIWCLADFGPSACRLSLSQRGEYSLTPAYAAPEQWRGLPVTDRSDIYAFGIVAFELLNGMRPFPGPTPKTYRQQHLYQTAPALIGMPPSLSALVARCLRKKPSGRPAAAEILAAVEATRSDRSAPTDPGRLRGRYEDFPTAPLFM